MISLDSVKNAYKQAVQKKKKKNEDRPKVSNQPKSDHRERQSHNTTQKSYVSKSVKKQQEKGYNETAGGRFTQGVIRNAMFAGAPRETTATYYDNRDKQRKVSESKAYKAGKIIGDFISYGTGYGAVGKGIAKATGKTVAKKALAEAGEQATKKVAKEATEKVAKKAATEATEKAVKKTTEKLAKQEVGTVGRAINKTNEKLGEKIAGTKAVQRYAEKQAAKAGKEATKEKISRDIGSKAAEKITQNLIADATVGTALDTAHAYGEGIDIGANKEYAKYMGTAALANVGMGAGFEGLSAGAKAIVRKRTAQKLAKQGLKNLSDAQIDSIIKAKESKAPIPKPQESPQYAEGLAKDKAEADALFKNIKKPSYKTERKQAIELSNIQKAKEYTDSHDIKFSDVVEEHGGDRNKAIRDLVKRSKEEQAAKQVATNAPEQAVVEQNAVERVAGDKEFEKWRDLRTDEGDANVSKVIEDMESKGLDTDDDDLVEEMLAKQYLKDTGKDAPVVAEKTSAATEKPSATEGQPVAAEKVTDNVVTQKVPKDEIGTATARDVINSETPQAERISGYEKLDKGKQKELRKALENKEFVEKLRDEKWMNKFEEGQSQNKFSDANQMLEYYKSFDSNGDFRIAENEFSSVKEKPKFMQRLRDFVGKSTLEFQKQFTDTAEAIWRLSRKYDDENLYAMLDRLRQIKGYSSQMINGDKQVIITKDGFEDVGKSIKGIFEPIINRGNDYYVDFQKFMFNRHNIHRYAKGKPVYGITHTITDSKQVLDELTKKYGKDGIKEFEEYAEEVYKYNDALLRMERDSGLISEKTYKTLKEDYPYYVPTYRYDMSDSGVVKDINEIGTKMFPKAVGSDKDILPLHEQMIHRTQSVSDATAMNDFGLRLMKDMKENGDLIGKMEEVAEKDIEPDSITDIANNTFQKNLEEKDGKYIFNVKENGKVVRIPVDKEVFKAIKSLDDDVFKIPLLYQSSKVFRGLVTTYNPTFGPTNGIKDFIDAPSFSKNGWFKFVAKYPQAWKMMASNHPTYQIYKALGGESGNFFDIGQEFANHTWFRRNTLDRLEAIQSAIEQAPRFTEFMLTLEKGGNTKENIIQAFHDSKAVTVNFGQYGKLGRNINANGIPFFNAAMQDAVRISRAVQRGNIMPIVVGAAAFGIAPAAFNELMWGDDENYKAIRRNEKDVNYFIPSPFGDGHYVRIPKGRVISALTMPVERGIRQYLGHGDERPAFEGMFDSMKQQVAPKNPFEDNLLTPAMEVRKENGRTWYGADIVPDNMKKLPDAEQYDENTTKVARKIGEITNKSPKRIDYLLKQYTGFTGTLLRSNSITGSDTATPYGAVGTKFIADAVTNNELQSRVYDLKSKYEKQKNSMNATEKDKLDYKYLDAAAKEMSEYNKQVKEIQADTYLSKAEKLKKIRRIREEQNEKAREYLNGEEKFKTASTDAVRQVDKNAFDTTTAYEKALKTQMDVNMRGANAVLKEMDESYRERGWTPISEKLKEAGLSANEYFDMQAKGVSVDSFIAAREHGTDLDKYNDYVKITEKYKNGYASHAMELISSKMVKDEDEANEVYGIRKASYRAAQYYLENGYTPEQIYELTGDVDKVVDEVKEKYGHRVYRDGRIVMSYEGLKKYLDSRKELTNAQRHNLWYIYGGGQPAWVNRNPY